MASSSGVLPSLVFAFTSAPSAISSSAIPLWPLIAAQCKGVLPVPPFAFTSVPSFKCCLTASMFPNSTATTIDSAAFSSSLVLPPCLRSRSVIRGCLKAIATSSGVLPISLLEFTSTPSAKCCLTASIFPVCAPVQISTLGPHPTTNKAATIVIRCDFTVRQPSSR